MDPVSLDPEIAVVLEQLNAHPLARFEGMTPQQARDLLAETFPPVFEPPVARVEDLQIVVADDPGGVIGARLYHPAPGETLPLVVFFHGGGWVWGTLDQSEGDCRLMAAVGNVAVLSVDYRLAPEHRFPAAADDAVAATRWALHHAAELGADPSRVGVAGDSAGGNLSAVATLALRGESAGTDPLKAQLLIYPAVDCDLDRPSMHTYGEGYLLERVHMDWFYDHYAPDRVGASDPRLTPLFAGSHAGLPPAVVLLAEVDVLRDEGEAYAAVLQEAGVPCDLIVAKGLIHGFIGFWPASVAAREAYEGGIRRFAALLAAEG
ncbi:MAG: alpha/beta hydrolase [Planctomycetes bacterium]|nr:alpha/beta hydrolase [Planctomycetota bacterium]